MEDMKRLITSMIQYDSIDPKVHGDLVDKRKNKKVATEEIIKLIRSVSLITFQNIGTESNKKHRFFFSFYSHVVSRACNRVEKWSSIAPGKMFILTA